MATEAVETPSITNITTTVSEESPSITNSIKTEDNGATKDDKQSSARTANDDVDRRISPGETVVLQKFNYMRVHVLNTKKNLQLGRDIVNLEGVVGEKYGTTFEMVPNPDNKKQYFLRVADEVVDFESLFLTGEGGRDNRDLTDGESSQNLSREQIEELRDTGTSGTDIMMKLIENSETYQGKTKFSQAKFLSKKAKKYHQYVMIRKPSIRLLMDINYKMDPVKMMNLRIDSLSQILNMANVQSGGRYLVYETGAKGLVVAAMIERVGDAGEVIHVYQTGQPQTTALNSIGLQESEQLRTINIQHLRSLEQGRDILENHPQPHQQQASTEQQPEQQSQLNGSKHKDSGVNTTTPEECGEEPAMKRLKTSSDCKDTTSVPGVDGAYKSVRMNLREKSVEAFKSLKPHSMDGLVIVCKQHPANLLLYLSKYVGLSRPFCVYSAYKEPLLDTYIQIKEAGIAVMVNLSETWLRNHQVLPKRTHPTVLMSGGGGYLLTGLFVEGK